MATLDDIRKRFKSGDEPSVEFSPGFHYWCERCQGYASAFTGAAYAHKAVCSTCRMEIAPPERRADLRPGAVCPECAKAGKPFPLRLASRGTEAVYGCHAPEQHQYSRMLKDDQPPKALPPLPPEPDEDYESAPTLLDALANAAQCHKCNQDTFIYNTARREWGCIACFFKQSAEATSTLIIPTPSKGELRAFNNNRGYVCLRCGPKNVSIIGANIVCDGCGITEDYHIVDARPNAQGTLRRKVSKPLPHAGATCSLCGPEDVRHQHADQTYACTSCGAGPDHFKVVDAREWIP